MVNLLQQSGIRRTGALVIVLAAMAALFPSTVASAGDRSGVRNPATMNGTIVTVTGTPNPAALLEQVAFTAVVDCTAGGDPTGSVTFTDTTTGVTLGTASGGTAGPGPHQRTYSLPPLFLSPLGPHVIEAAYISTNPSCPDATGTTTVQINPTGTSTTTLTASPNPATVGAPTTLTANVVCASGTPAGGKVTFFDGPDLLDTVPVSVTSPTTGRASLTTTFATPGVHHLTASYSGTGTCSASFTVIDVEVRDQTSATTVSASPNPVLFGQPVTLTATVTCVTGSPAGGTVTFTDTTTGTSLGSATVSPSGKASITVPGLTPGTHAIRATFGGISACTPSSATVAVTVAVSQTISGEVFHSVSITVPTRIVPGTRIHGDVVISGSGALDAESVQILGALTAVGGTGLRVCGSTVRGEATVNGVIGVVVIGDAGDDGNPPCPGNVFENAVTLNGINGSVEFSGNAVWSSVTVNGTLSTLRVPPENSFATELESNRISGNLTCNGNVPPPVNDGKPNVVGGVRYAQCIGL